jgi:tetratricopeptide (TPR) repeat protein
LTFEANKIIAELLSHEFRPDGIAYLLILIGESLLKGPKLLKRNRLPGYEIPTSSFNSIATDIFKKVYLSEELSKKAKSLDDKVIKSQLKEKADFFQTIWSSLQIEIGHCLYAIPREYFHDSEQPKPYTSRLKELCCIARINYAIANIIEARPENLEIGRQTVEDLKRDLEIGVGNQFFEISEIRVQAMENLLEAFDYGVGSDYEGGTRVTPAYESQCVFIETAVVLENISLLARVDGSKVACETPVLVSEKTMALELLETVLAGVPGLNLRSVLKELRKPREEPILFDHRNLKRISDLCGLTFQTCCVKTDANVGHVFTLLDASIGAIAYSSIPDVYAVLETQTSVKTVVAAFILSNPTINEIVDRLNAETNEEMKAGLSNDIARHYRNEADQLDLKHHLLALPKWHKALKFYSDANDLCPTNRTAILGQVRCLIALNRYKKAKKLLSNNHSQVLECGEFYSLLALANRRMRNYADASFNLQKATDLGLGNRAERKVLEAFKEKQIIKKHVEFYRKNSVTKNCKKDGFKPYNILTVDGGGVRGLIPAVWLSELERRAGRSCSSLFHMMAGTSTGAIIVAGLSTPDLDNVQVPRYKASEILELYSEKASNIFTSSLSPISKIYQVLSHSPKYSDSGRRTLFELYFGKTLFSKSLTDLVIPTVKSGTNGSVIFSSRDIGKDPLTRNFTMKDVLMCTTAAPTFFPPHSLGNTLYIDGGVQANNPTMIAYVKAIKDYEIPRDDIFTWSLGTGDYVPNELDPAANRDLLFWIANREEIPKVIFDGPMNNIDQQMYGLLNEGRYNRWQVWLEDRVALDDYNEKTLELLFDIAKEHYEVLDAYDDSRRLGVVIERLRGEIA